MATYFDGSSSEIQAGSDGLQTLILMNPTGYLGYSDTTDQQPQNNLVYLNSDILGGGGGGGGGGSGGSSFNALQPTQSQPQHLLGIPLATPAAATSSHDHTHSQHDMSLLHAFLPRVQYNVYNSQKVVAAACETPRAQQGLSLSLSSQLPPQNVSVSTGGGGGGACYSSSSMISNNGGGMQNVMLSSKYLKATQELLDEVVNVGKGAKSGGSDKRDDDVDQESLSEIAAGGGGGEGGNGWENGGKRGGELNTAERQDIQMKKAKLISMLDEVEQRYRQYHHQMQTVASMFEQTGGIGSAKAYTALALQTISKQFRSLKDAILSQLQVASKSLGEEEGEEESLGGKMKINGSIRMKHVDNQLRQQRALQQLGMVQHNAWRPQRGLPERSVSVLRAWLFEHFLHPYPKDSDKIMLAKQTGLTRSQVSNWFINARVRLWKPMVEEMYTEEIKEQEKNGSEEKSGKNEDAAATKTTPPPVTTSTLENQNKGYVLNHNVTSPMSSTSQARTNIDESPKKHVSVSTDTNEHHMSMKFDTERQTTDGFSLLGGGGFSAYPPIAELGRFNADQQQFPTTSYSGNGVSLTLGLPHCDNNLGPHHTFLPNQNNIQLPRGGGNVDIGEAHDVVEYGSIEQHQITLPEYMRESTFRATRGGLLHDYYHTL